MKLRRIGLSTILAVILAQPAGADIVLHGPPVLPIELSRSKVEKMTNSARAAVANIFTFSAAQRPEYLNEAYRAAGKLGIHGLNRIVSVVVLGNRAFILTVTDNWGSPLMTRQAYTYFQCKFDDNGEVVAIDPIS